VIHRTPDEEGGSRRILEKIWTIFRARK